MPVVIAAHPSSTYNNSEFGDRTIIINKTAQLIKDADIVLLHESTSHIFAILFDKPITFFKTNGMSFHIGVLAGFFRKPVYNIDKVQYGKIEFSKVDKGVRENYIYTQLTSKKTENMSNKEIVLGEIDKIFKKLSL